jgi:MFS family permease
MSNEGQRPRPSASRPLRPMTRAVGTRVPGPWAVVGVSLAALAAGTFATVGIGALAPELQEEFDFSRGEIGLLTALVSLGSALASRRAGALTDSVGPVRVLAVALVFLAAAIVVAAAAPLAVLFMAAMLAAGFAYGGISPPTNVVVAGRMERRLGVFLSLKQTGVPVGAFLAGLVLPPLAIWVSWRFAFGVAGVAALAVAISATHLRGAAVLPSAGTVGDGDGPSRRERISMGFYGFVMAGSQWAFVTYVVLYLTESGGFSLRGAGLVLSLAMAVSVAGRIFWGWLSDRPGRRVSSLVWASMLALGMLALFAGGVSGAAVWPIAAMTGAALVGWNGAFHALITSRAEYRGIGRLSGEMMVLVFAGCVFFPPLLGFVSEALDSWTVLWAGAAVSVALAGVVLWAGSRKPAPRAARALADASE